MPTSKFRRIGWQRRQKFAAAEKPTFFEYDLETGLIPIVIDFLDWGIGEVTDEVKQERVLSIELVRVTPDSSEKLNDKGPVTHVKVDGLYYKFKGARKTLGDRNDWVIRCSISGEKEPVP